MTYYEKLEAAYNYCINTNCNDCTLRDRDWKHHYLHDKFKCIQLFDADEEELDKALELISAVTPKKQAVQTYKHARHLEICERLNALYDKKNTDYDDAFAKSFEQYGLIMSCIRIEDKLNRLKAFAKNGELQVNDESFTDTLMDIANYAIMTIIETEK